MSQYTTVAVQAYACGMCAQVHKDEGDADACCKCTQCGEKFEREGVSYSHTCDGCMYGTRVRECRKDVAREADSLRHAISRLRGLIAHPPSGKKAPKKGVAQALVDLEPFLQDLHVRIRRIEESEGAS
jgi:hypothetical protein